MPLMDLMPIHRKSDTSTAAKDHKTRPYLLRGLRVDRPSQVWRADITCLPTRRGFVHLGAIMDRHSRKALAWRMSNTLAAKFCVAHLNRSIHRYGLPEILDMDLVLRWRQTIITLIHCDAAGTGIRATNKTPARQLNHLRFRHHNPISTRRIYVIYKGAWIYETLDRSGRNSSGRCSGGCGIS
ncbi:DDE-type integrase/transposase/recombinase [Roseovarius dicentrarchi]|uniref:DDE-type integrase/transposase/recombinase n=1 Tax=Roseovarius dicentrarchi TaxID=2250573 RepID=UPI000DE83D94|nr:DDE-type integrase/transposase/recombinase [Roseovarius dicentrarchi]